LPSPLSFASPSHRERFALNHLEATGGIRWVDFVFYSVVTSTTLGFGDIVLTHWPARLVVMGEVVLGYVMLGGLVSIFANKLARRN